jgi:hypothetical protein
MDSLVRGNSLVGIGRIDEVQESIEDSSSPMNEAEKVPHGAGAYPTHQSTLRHQGRRLKVTREVRARFDLGRYSVTSTIRNVIVEKTSTSNGSAAS